MNIKYLIILLTPNLCFAEGNRNNAKNILRAIRSSNYHLGISMIIAFLAFHFWMRFFTSVRDKNSNLLSLLIPIGLSILIFTWKAILIEILK